MGKSASVDAEKSMLSKLKQGTCFSLLHFHVDFHLVLEAFILCSVLSLPLCFIELELI